jgi:hypothetical protein
MGYFFSLFSLSKSTTETAVNVAEVVILASSLVLVFGAIGEYLEGHHGLPAWMEWPKIVFIVLVVIGLIGEVIGDAGVYVFSEHLQSINDAEESALRRQVKSEIDARLKLEKEFLWEGPRDVLIRSSQDMFKIALERFSGQKFKMSICTPDMPGPHVIVPFDETARAAQAMRIVLYKCGWNVMPWPSLPSPFIPLTTNACGSNGIFVAVKRNAPESTRAAGRALQELINKALSQEVEFGRGTTPALSQHADSLPDDEIDIDVGGHPVLQGNPLLTAPP